MSRSKSVDCDASDLALQWVQGNQGVQDHHLPQGNQENQSYQVCLQIPDDL